MCSKVTTLRVFSQAQHIQLAGMLNDAAEVVAQLVCKINVNLITSSDVRQSIWVVDRPQRHWDTKPFTFQVARFALTRTRHGPHGGAAKTAKVRLASVAMISFKQDACAWSAKSITRMSEPLDRILLLSIGKVLNPCCLAHLDKTAVPAQISMIKRSLWPNPRNFLKLSSREGEFFSNHVTCPAATALKEELLSAPPVQSLPCLPALRSKRWLSQPPV